MSISRFRTDADAAAAPEVAAERGVPTAAAAPTRSPQDAQRFRALVQARTPDAAPVPEPEATRGGGARDEDAPALHERPERDGRWRWPEDEPTDLEGAVVPVPLVPLPDLAWGGKAPEGKREPLHTGSERSKPLATQASMRAERSAAARSVAAIGGVPARSFAALQAAMASLPLGQNKSSRFSVDADGLGRIGFLVRRDQAHTHVVLELDRHALDQAPGLRQSVQSWLEARGNTGVRVAVALRSSATRKGSGPATDLERSREKGSDDE